MKARTVEELLALRPPNLRQIISHGLLLPGTRMVLFGLPETWKSMLAMHTAFCLTEHRPWLGFTTSQAKVLMVQVEIPEYLMGNRVKQYLASNGRVPPTGLHIASEMYMRLDQPAMFADFEDTMTKLRPDVVILDPLYRLFSGDINDNYQLQNLLDRLDLVGNRYNTAYIIIGHRRKPAQEFNPDTSNWDSELIGGSYVMNWADTMIAMDKVSDTEVMMYFCKVRHAQAEMKPIKVVVDRKTLGFRLMPV